MSLDKLDETASFSRRNLDVGDLAETLEEGTELVLSHISGQTTDKDSRVVWISELIHWLRGAVVADWRHAHLHHTHLVHAARLVLWGRS